MAFDRGPRPTTGDKASTPMRIATHRLFTPREKLNLLHRLRAEVTGEHANPAALDFAPADIDEAIARVHRDAQAGTDASRHHPSGQ